MVVVHTYAHGPDMTAGWCHIDINNVQTWLVGVIINQ